MQENIDIDLSILPRAVYQFVEMELDQCRALNVPINMPNTRSVLSNGVDCAGFFDDNPLEFAVACGKTYKKWFPVFVHESCHRDQWSSDPKLWNKRVDGMEPMVVFDEWIQGNVELDADVLRRITTVMLEVELDCEMRSAAKIRQHRLPIKLDTYIRKSNAYVWSYRLMQETRIWNHSAAYEYPQVWRKMPKEFCDDYAVMPNHIRSIFDTVLDELTDPR